MTLRSGFLSRVSEEFGFPIREVFAMRKMNVKLSLLFEVILFAVVFYLAAGSANGFPAPIQYFIDIPTILIILAIVIVGMLVFGCQKDFHKAFSIGQKNYSLLELKNIKLSVSVCQRLIVCGSLISIVIGVISFLQNFSDPATTGPALAVAFLSAFYGAVLEYLTLPLYIASERAINQAMDLGELDEDGLSADTGHWTDTAPISVEKKPASAAGKKGPAPEDKSE